MRKNNRQVKAYLFPKIQSAVITTEPPSDALDSLQKYQMQFFEQGESPLVNFRVNRRHTRANTLPYEDSNLASGIKEVSKELNDLKKQIRSRRYSKKEEENSRLGKLLESVEDNLIRNRSMPPSTMPQAPIYVPFPFPMYMPQPSYRNQGDSFYRRSTRKGTSSLRFNRGRNNLKKWRKVGNCILFYFYLKRFCKLVQFNRKLAFEKFMANIKPHLFAIKKLMTQSLKEFLSIILIKKEVSFDFQEEDNKEVIREKANSLRKLIGLILESLLDVARKQINSTELLESLYFLCKHGNYSCNEPLLTKEELQVYSISPTFKYISADKHLEKSALINLILIKLLIYNTLLSPYKIGPKFTEYEIPQNLYMVSSVLYEFCIDFQDEVMMLVDPIYAIGNYESVQKVRVLESIIVKGGKHREGEVISGLKDEEWVKKYFKFKNWNQERKNLKLLIDLLQLIHSIVSAQKQRLKILHQL